MKSTLAKSSAHLAAALFFIFGMADSVSAHFNEAGIDIPVTNGTVYAQALAQDYGIIGGDFTIVGPATGSAAPIDVNSANADAFLSSLAKVNDSTYAAISDNQGGWFIGGNFTKVGGRSRNRIAHIFSDGSLDDSFNPDANGIVRALALSADGSTLYAGGEFTVIGGVTRNYLASINVSGGSATQWDPNANGAIRALALSPDGATLYAGGDFTSISGTARNRLSSFSTQDGALSAWDPNANGAVRALALIADGATLYVGGDFTNVNSTARNRIAAVNSASAAVSSWNPNSNGIVHALAFNSAQTLIYAGGEFNNIGASGRSKIAALEIDTGNATAWNPSLNNTVRAIALDLSEMNVYIGGDFTKVNGVKNTNYLVDLDPADASLKEWKPRANAAVHVLVSSPQVNAVYAGGDFGSVGGEEMNNLAVFNKNNGSILTGWNADPNLPVRALAISADNATVYAGGEFTSIGGAPRNRLAAIDINSALATSFDPNANDIVRSLAISADGATLYAGGDFSTIGGLSRSRLAAINTGDGAVTSFDPQLGGSPPPKRTVQSIILRSGTSTMFVAGMFNSAGPDSRSNIAEIQLENGRATSWNPGADNKVRSLAFDESGQILFAGGDFALIGGAARNYIGAISATSGAAISWNPNANGIVYSLALSPDKRTVFAGGEFTSAGGVARNRLSALRTSDGSALPWNPNMDNAVYSIILEPNTAENLYAGGAFKTVGGVNAKSSARFGSPVVAFTLNGAAGANNSYGQEDENTASIEVRLVDSVSGELLSNNVDVTVDFALEQMGGAEAGVDFNLPASPFVIPAGQTSANIPITIIDDSFDEEDEPIVIVLSNPSNARIDPLVLGGLSKPTHVHIILDNDAPPIIQFATTSGSGLESASNPPITLQLSQASGKDVYAGFLVGGTSEGGGVDHDLPVPPVLATYVIPAGQTSVNIPVNVADDAIPEQAETIDFALSESNVANATIGSNANFSYSIIDND